MPVAANRSSVPGSSGQGSGIAGSDFITLGDVKKQCIALIYGDPKTGKTTFVTDYCPDPIAFINYDGRAEHAVKKALNKGRRILFLPIAYAADDISKLDHAKAKLIGQAVVEQTIRNLKWAVTESKKGNIKTIAIDTGTEYDEILKLAVRGTLETVQGDFGRSKNIMNEQWARIFQIARGGKAHLIVLARTQEIWVGNAPTGRFGARGNDQMEILADWTGHIRVKRRRREAPKFELEIVRSGVNIGEMGSVYTEDEWGEQGANVGPFAWACVHQYPDSELSDWQ
jgi:hypothetical protein